MKRKPKKADDNQETLTDAVNKTRSLRNILPNKKPPTPVKRFSTDNLVAVVLQKLKYKNKEENEK